METEPIYKNRLTGQTRWLIGEANGIGSLMHNRYVIACNEAGDLMVSQRAEFYRTNDLVLPEVSNG